MDAYVWIKHPGLPDNVPVEQPRAAFDAVYGPQGWVEADPPDEPDSGPGIPAAAPDEAVSADEKDEPPKKQARRRAANTENEE